MIAYRFVVFFMTRSGLTKYHNPHIRITVLLNNSLWYRLVEYKLKQLTKQVVFSIAFGLAASVSFGSTCVQNGNELSGLLGLDRTDGTIFVRTESSSNDCGCGNVRFTSSNTDVEMALSILLAAKMSDRTVRIDLLEAGNCNSAYRVYIEK